MAETKTARNVQHVTDADFESSILQAGKPALVDFWAAWCGPCRIIGPIIEDLAPGYDGKAIIAKLDVDANPGVAQRYQITSIPTLLMFKGGRVVDRVIGVLPKGELQKFIERNL